MDGLAPDFVPDRHIIYLPPQGYPIHGQTGLSGGVFFFKIK
jgi:hypothetical protein